MPAITIRVGASVDRNLATALHPLMESAKRARAQVDSEMKGVGRSIASETKKGSKAADEAFAKLVAEVSGKGGKMMSPSACIRSNATRHVISLSSPLGLAQFHKWQSWRDSAVR